MQNIIGFIPQQNENTQNSTHTAEQPPIAPRKSVVEVKFHSNSKPLSYYNDLFDLHYGDIVFVDGVYEGIRGCVTNVSYNFKIKVSDYKRVIAVADTDVHGQFHIANSHFITFDSFALPIEKAKTWYIPPQNFDEEIVLSCDDTHFFLENLKSFKVDSGVAERGEKYYINNKVRYLCINGTKGYAIIEGSNPYEVEFTLHNGEISELVCTCLCSYNCKHEVATLLQLKETLSIIEKNYAKEYKESNYFSAISKVDFFNFVLNAKETVTFKLN